MADLFKALKKEEGAAGEIPQFLSTHPLTTERIKTVEKEIAKHNYTSSEDVVLDSLFREIKKNLDM
jgi:predicted Zn-dependent protease